MRRIQFLRKQICWRASGSQCQRSQALAEGKAMDARKFRMARLKQAFLECNYRALIFKNWFRFFRVCEGNVCIVPLDRTLT